MQISVCTEGLLDLGKYRIVNVNDMTSPVLRIRQCLESSLALQKIKSSVNPKCSEAKFRRISILSELHVSASFYDSDGILD